MNESFVRFESSGTELVGVITRPEGRSRGAVLIVHPFGEEKKFAHRVLVSTAWALAKAGFMTLRFDLSGCGDSFGSFRDASITEWVGDVKSAGEVLRRETGSPEATLLGLRLGATLCVLAAGEMDKLRSMVLWEPILSGRQYMETLWRKKLIKEMMTSGRGRTSFDAARSEIERTGYIDLDGWDLGARMMDELIAVDIRRSGPPCPCRTLAVQIAFNGKVSKELEDFARTTREAGGKVEPRGIRERAIWDRIDIVPATELIESTVSWLSESSDSQVGNNAT